MTEIRRLADAELGQIGPLFERVFGVPFNRALIDWKYAGGRGESWTGWLDATAPAIHCGLAFRDVRWRGAVCRAAQLTDLMALPKAGGLSRRHSPFVLLTRRILAGLPRADNPQGLAFGFPSARAMRLGEHCGVYRAVDRLFELEFHPQRSRFAPRYRAIAALDAPDAAMANRLWLAMAQGLTDHAVGIRDPGYLDRRYVRHPAKRYSLLAISGRWLRQPIGLAVIGPGQAGCYELLDVVGAWRDMPEIIAALKDWLASTGGTRIAWSLTRSFALPLAPCATACTETEFRIMANPETPETALKALEQRWWLTGGDTDYR